MKPVMMSLWQRFGLMVWAGATVGVAFLSLLPETSAAVHDVSPVWTDAGHVPAYALLATVTIAGVARFMRLTTGVLWVVAALVSVFGLGIEMLQPLVGRSASLLDAGSNVAGAAIAAFGYQLWAAARLVATRDPGAHSNNVAHRRPGK